MANPYHVRLAISQYGDQFRAELFTEDLGDPDVPAIRVVPDHTCLFFRLTISGIKNILFSGGIMYANSN